MLFTMLFIYFIYNLPSFSFHQLKLNRWQPARQAVQAIELDLLDAPLACCEARLK